MVVKTRAQGKTLPAFTVTTRPAPSSPKQGVSPDMLSGVAGVMSKQAVRTWLTTRYSPPVEETSPPAKVKRTAKPKAEEKSKPKRSRKPSASDGLKDYE
jgi:hypothetical protein